MNVTEREKVLFRIGAAWKAMPSSTLAVWSEHLEPMDYQTAVKAVRMLERTKPFAPSLAEMHDAYKAATPSEFTKAITAPVDVSGRARVHAIIDEFRNRKVEPITAKMLDEAGVKHWRARLADAMELDVDRGTQRANFDLAWAEIRNEFKSARELGMQEQNQALR